jgi:2-oxoglutarate dehydrogenase E1 component
MYINNYEKCNWIRQRFEDLSQKKLAIEDIQRGVKRLIRASKYKRKSFLFQYLSCRHRFEDYLKKKWSSEKRFGLEGLEVLIPAMKMVIDTTAKQGVDTVIIGMPHRFVIE